MREWRRDDFSWEAQSVCVRERQGEKGKTEIESETETERDRDRSTNLGPLRTDRDSVPNSRHKVHALMECE